jgi:glycosyltransferase involved in cell wall biosynthesis
MLASYLALLGNRKTVLINGEHGVIYAEKLWQRLLQRFLFNRVNINLCVSSQLRDHIAQVFGVRKDRFLPIINGVDTNRFKPNPALRERLRQELGLDAAFVIGSVGRLVPVKDYDTLIRAVALLSRRQHCFRLVLVGGGPEEQKLKSLVQEQGVEERVLFMGRRNDIAELMNIFDVFVLTSLTEGLSNTLLEAMATGLPVVATAVGGNPEIVFEGENGRMLATGDSRGLAAILEELAENPDTLRGMAQNALLFTQTQCSLRNMVENYEQTYRQLV